jgi:ammonia channel protein AmtB
MLKGTPRVAARVQSLARQPTIWKVVVTTAGASIPGYTTYIFTASLHDTAASLYSIEGTPDGIMEIPPAYQVARPFGAGLGGVDPSFWAVANNAGLGFAQYDSWHTVGITDGGHGRLGSIGIDLSTWTETAGLSIDDGAVFCMDPEHAPGVMWWWHS